MNRKIKFRGKRKDNNEWVYGYLISEEVIGEVYIEKDKTYTIKSYNVFPASIGQWTWFKDKNGTDIYEGDILAINKELSDNKLCMEFGFIEYDYDKGFIFHIGYRGNKHICFEYMDFDNYHIVGNMFDDFSIFK